MKSTINFTYWKHLDSRDVYTLPLPMHAHISWVILFLHSDWVPFTGDSLGRSYLFYDRPSTLYSQMPPQWRLSGFGCVLDHCATTIIWRMRTFDENSCVISITSDLGRSLSPLRTQHVWWDHREKSQRASTLWDCRGKSHLADCYKYSLYPRTFAEWNCLPARVRDAPTIGTFKDNVKLVNMGTIIEKAHFKN